MESQATMEDEQPATSLEVQHRSVGRNRRHLAFAVTRREDDDVEQLHCVKNTDRDNCSSFRNDVHLNNVTARTLQTRERFTALQLGNVSYRTRSKQSMNTNQSTRKVRQNTHTHTHSYFYLVCTMHAAGVLNVTSVAEKCICLGILYDLQALRVCK